MRTFDHEHMFADGQDGTAAETRGRGAARDAYFWSTTIVLTFAVTPSPISTTTM
jgi:hypothetical protein